MQEKKAPSEGAGDVEVTGGLIGGERGEKMNSNKKMVLTKEIRVDSNFVEKLIVFTRAFLNELPADEITRIIVEYNPSKSKTSIKVFKEE